MEDGNIIKFKIKQIYNIEKKYIEKKMKSKQRIKTPTEYKVKKNPFISIYFKFQ